MKKMIETTKKATKTVVKYSLGVGKSYAQYKMFLWSLMDDATSFGLDLMGEQEFREGIDDFNEVTYIIKDELEKAALEKVIATLEKATVTVEKTKKEKTVVKKEVVKTEVIPA